MAEKTYRVMGRSGPIGRGLTLEDAEKLAAVSGCTVEEEQVVRNEETRLQTRTQFHATFIGRGEFYSGIRHGERVLLNVETTVYVYEREQRSSTHLDIQALDGNSPHLSVRIYELTDIGPVVEIPSDIAASEMFPLGGKNEFAPKEA